MMLSEEEREEGARGRTRSSRSDSSSCWLWPNTLRTIGVLDRAGAFSG